MTYNPLQGMSQAQLAAHTQAAMNVMLANHTQAMALQGQAAQQQRQFNAAAWPEQRYKIDGKYMSLQEFVDFIWPEDCPDKTFFLLKHTKETQ